MADQLQQQQQQQQHASNQPEGPRPYGYPQPQMQMHPFHMQSFPPYIHPHQLTAMQDQATLLSRLRTQVEFYFSPQNLARDNFLRSLLQAPENGGAVPVTVIANFPKVRELYARSIGIAPPAAAPPADPALFQRALQESQVVIVSDDGNWIRPRAFPDSYTVAGGTNDSHKGVKSDRPPSPNSQTTSTSSSAGVPTVPIPSKERRVVRVGGMSPETTVEEISAAFTTSVGAPESVRLDDAETGTWFIFYKTEKDATVAVSETKEKELRGVPIRAEAPMVITPENGGTEPISGEEGEGDRAATGVPPPQQSNAAQPTQSVPTAFHPAAAGPVFSMPYPYGLPQPGYGPPPGHVSMPYGSPYGVQMSPQTPVRVMRPPSQPAGMPYPPPFDMTQNGFPPVPVFAGHQPAMGHNHHNNNNRDNHHPNSRHNLNYNNNNNRGHHQHYNNNHRQNRGHGQGNHHNSSLPDGIPGVIPVDMPVRTQKKRHKPKKTKDRIRANYGPDPRRSDDNTDDGRRGSGRDGPRGDYRSNGNGSSFRHGGYNNSASSNPANRTVRNNYVHNRNHGRVVPGGSGGGGGSSGGGGGGGSSVSSNNSNNNARRRRSGRQDSQRSLHNGSFDSRGARRKQQTTPPSPPAAQQQQQQPPRQTPPRQQPQKRNQPQSQPQRPPQKQHQQLNTFSEAAFPALGGRAAPNDQEKDSSASGANKPLGGYAEALRQKASMDNNNNNNNNNNNSNKKTTTSGNDVATESNGAASAGTGTRTAKTTNGSDKAKAKNGSSPKKGSTARSEKGQSAPTENGKGNQQMNGIATSVGKLSMSEGKPDSSR